VKLARASLPSHRPGLTSLQLLEEEAVGRTVAGGGHVGWDGGQALLGLLLLLLNKFNLLLSYRCSGYLTKHVCKILGSILSALKNKTQVLVNKTGTAKTSPKRYNIFYRISSLSIFIPVAHLILLTMLFLKSA